jgi:hypothetical protein
MGRRVADTPVMANEEVFDPDLLRRIRKVVDEGDVILTLGTGRENRIGEIRSDGIQVTTERSSKLSGGAALVPAWMFNRVWSVLQTSGTANRQFLDRDADGPKVKRSSAVFAVLAMLPEVEIAARRPLVLRIGNSLHHP